MISITQVFTIAGTVDVESPKGKNGAEYTQCIRFSFTSLNLSEIVEYKLLFLSKFNYLSLFMLIILVRLDFDLRVTNT
jgi:hypothetical protein